MLTDQYPTPPDESDPLDTLDSPGLFDSTEAVESTLPTVPPATYEVEPAEAVEPAPAPDPFDQLPPLVPPLPLATAATPFSAPSSARFPSLGRTPYEPPGVSNPPVSRAVPPPVEPKPTIKPPVTSPSARSAPIIEEPAEAEVLDAVDVLPHSRPIEPALIYLILLAVMVLGLGGLAPAVRYTALWAVLIVVAIMAMLFDNLEVEIPTAPDMTWGIGYGLILGLPLLVIALPQLKHTSLLLFDQTADTLAFQSLAIIMPTAETLFFRGAMQPTRGLLFTALAGSAWSILMFFPQLHVVEAPLVAVVIGFAFVVLNFLYSYIKRRFGLFASWTCQITITVLLLFVCRFL
jgi:hypothetical protein